MIVGETKALSISRSALILLGLLGGTLVGIGARYSDPPVLLALGVALIGGVLTLIRVEIGVLALIFAAYTRFSDVLLERGVPFSVIEVLVVGLLAVVVLRWYLFRETPKGWLRPAFLLGLYGMVGLATLLYAADGGAAADGLINYVQDVILVLLIVIGLQRAGAVRRASWSLLAAGIFLGTLSVLQQMTGSYGSTFGGFSVAEIEHIAGETSGFRIGGPMGAPNFYAMILVPLVPLAIDRMWRERQWLLRLAASWALAVTLLSIVFTYSRGGVLALAVVLGLTLLRLRRSPRLLLVVGLAGLLLVAVLPAGYGARLATLEDVLNKSDNVVPAELSIRGRLSEWHVGWQMFRDQPLGGVGLANYPEHYLEYSSQLGLDWRRTGRSPHSLYLEIASETGVIGVLAFLALVGSLFYSLAYAYRQSKIAGQEERAGLMVALAIGLAGYLTASIFLHAAYPRFFWILAGIAFAAPLVASRNRAGGV